MKDVLKLKLKIPMHQGGNDSSMDDMEYEELLEKAVEDEKEAIMLYQKLIMECGADEASEKQQFQQIKSDEERHLKILNSIVAEEKNEPEEEE